MVIGRPRTKCVSGKTVGLFLVNLIAILDLGFPLKNLKL